MTGFGIAARVAALVAAFVLLAPLQALARSAGWRWGETVPVAFHRLFLALFGIRVRVRGNPPEQGVPTLVLANHVSWLDIPVMASTVPLSFIAKSEIAGWPVFGFLAKLQRCIFLDRNRKAATAEVNSVVAERLARGDVIVLFPEGTTGDGNRLLPFRSSLVGAARAALVGANGGAEQPGIETIRLQPLAIAYTRRDGLPVTRRERPQIAWYGDMDLLPHLVAFLREGPVDAVLSWGDPILFGAATDRKHATSVAETAVRNAITSAIDA
jgi:1-acyl-sn-glycerol-3-phosphate acyltransferase